MNNACRLPIAVAGALMPDAHVGYGLPIGGVLATDQAVIPYAVGKDIACRMRLSILDLPLYSLENDKDFLIDVLKKEARFGTDTFKPAREHAIMDAPLWNEHPLLREVKDKARQQLGTSGSGNHFIEFGVLNVYSDTLDVEQGNYVALLSHSGSRGMGEHIANHYSQLARRLHPQLSDELAHLAWLDMNSEPGLEYWNAMELMGSYAAAHHELIHTHISQRLEASILATVENHHNFAWKEQLDGREVIVHRKGATPAGAGVMGVIPGSMATAGYVVVGKGNPESLFSASHGAGRRMSRAEAAKRFTWEQTEKILKKSKTLLISGGLDEAPMAYKDIEEVMTAQADLVDSVARFNPRIVRMAPSKKGPKEARRK